MSSYNNSTKASDSYALLAKLLNSGSDEDADRVYKALLSASESEYRSALDKTTAEYAKGRDVLSSNRAKADRYLSYFLSDGGYEGSGLAADARVKQGISYDNSTSELNEKEREAKAQLLAKKDSTQLELARQAYDAQQDRTQAQLLEKQLESDNYWKGKQYELDRLRTEQSQGEAGSDTSVEAYRTMLYNELYEKLDLIKTADEITQLYNSLTGENTKQSIEIYGEELYSQMVTDIREKMTAQIKKERFNKNVSEIYKMFSNAKKHYGEVYTTLYSAIMYNAQTTTDFTMEELNEAYRRFLEFN